MRPIGQSTVERQSRCGLRPAATLAACAAFLIATATYAAQVEPTDRVVTRVVVREHPAASSAAIGQLRPGERAELLGSVPAWHQVRLDNGTQGYVSKGWTRIVSDAPPTPAQAAFTIDFADVGTGLAAVIRGADFTVVYDGGSNDDLARGDDNRFLAYLQATAPGLTTIDHVILSHPHRDHVELLPDLYAEYQVKDTWDSGAVNPICSYRAFLTAVAAEPAHDYHTATQHFGTSEVEFEEKDCYGETLPAATLELDHSSVIDEFPVPLGQDASMTFLHADGSQHSAFNENSLVVRFDLGQTRVLFMGDGEAGGRASPSTPPAASSIEGKLLTCCESQLAASVLVVGHHGSKTSSRTRFLDAVGASTFVVSSGPMKYGTVVLPDIEVLAELTSRGQAFRTDIEDAACGQNAAKIGPDADGKPGGCHNVRVTIGSGNEVTVGWTGTD